MTSSQPDEVRDFVSRVEQLQQQRRKAMAAAEAATGRGTTPDGLATVSANAVGVLVDVTLAAAARPGPELAAQLVQAAARARKQALYAAAGEVAGILGPQSRAVTVLRRQAAESAESPGSLVARREFSGTVEDD